MGEQERREEREEREEREGGREEHQRRWCRLIKKTGSIAEGR